MDEYSFLRYNNESQPRSTPSPEQKFAGIPHSKSSKKGLPRCSPWAMWPTRNQIQLEDYRGVVALTTTITLGVSHVSSDSYFFMHYLGEMPSSCVNCEAWGMPSLLLRNVRNISWNNVHGWHWHHGWYGMYHHPEFFLFTPNSSKSTKTPSIREIKLEWT